MTVKLMYAVVINYKTDTERRENSAEKDIGVQRIYVREGTLIESVNDPLKL